MSAEVVLIMKVAEVSSVSRFPLPTELEGHCLDPFPQFGEVW